MDLADNIPFGSWHHLSRGLSDVYSNLLGVLAQQSNAAATLVRGLAGFDDSSRRTVLRDALVRRTVEDGVCRMLQGAESIDQATLDELLTITSDNLAAGKSLLNDPVSCVPLAGSGDTARFIFVDDRPDSVPGKRFAQQVCGRLPGFHIERPSEEQIATLRAADRLAARIVPDLANSAISHVFVVVVGTFQTAGPPLNAVTVPGLPGAMVLSRQAVSSELDTAETMVHESMHLKFLDIEYVLPLFAPGFRAESSPLVTPAWHLDDPAYGGWPLDRVLTSMHVYLALATFFAGAVELGEELYTEADRDRRMDRCLTRATWLYAAARDHLDHLSAHGRDFVAFLGRALAEAGALPN